MCVRENENEQTNKQNRKRMMENYNFHFQSPMEYIQIRTGLVYENEPTTTLLFFVGWQHFHSNHRENDDDVKRVKASLINSIYIFTITFTHTQTFAQTYRGS